MYAHPHRTLHFLLLAIGIGAVSLRGSAEVTAPTPFEAPFAAVVALAKARQLPISGIDAFRPGADLASGDFVTVLFTYREGSKRQQWLANFRVGELTPDERGHLTAAHRTIFTSTGRQFDFSSRLAALQLQMFGPVSPADSIGIAIAEKSARILVHADYLRAGFHRATATSFRLVAQKIDIPYNCAGAPFPPARVAQNKAAIAKTGITLDEERSYAAMMPALEEFLDLAQHTPGLEGLAYRIIDLPPIWSWITGGTTGFLFDPSRFARFDGEPWGLPGTTVYRAPLTYWLKGHAAANVVFSFAPADAPLLTCAGIVGMDASSPNHPEKHLELRVLAARRAAAGSEASTSP